MESQEISDWSGRKGLVVGIANEHGLAWWRARRFCNAATELALTYFNGKAKPHVAPLAEEIEGPLFLPGNVSAPRQLEAVFDAASKLARWPGRAVVGERPRERDHGRDRPRRRRLPRQLAWSSIEDQR